MMKEVKKSERVTWAAEANLCQVKFFSSEDCASEVGLEASNHPQPKVSFSNVEYFGGSNTWSAGSSEGRGYASPLTEKVLSHIPQIPWKTPTKFDLGYKCHVVAGEESEEKHRDMRELNAVYYHFSATPPSLLNSLDEEDHRFDDRHTPIIPLTGIEELEEMGFQSDKITASDISINSVPPKLPLKVLEISQQKPILPPGPSNSENSDTILKDLGPMVAATAVAAAAIMKSKEPGSLIDPELLIKLLSNPKMTEKLLIERGLASDTATGTSGTKVVELSIPRPISNSSFLIKKSTFEDCKPSISGTEATHKSLTVKQSSDAPGTPIANAAATESRVVSGEKQIQRPFYFLSSTSASLVQKSTSEKIQPANAGHEGLSWSVNQLLAANAKFGRGLGSNLVKTSVPLPSSTTDLLNEKSFSEHFQTADAGNVSILTSSHNLSSSTPDSYSKKSTNKHIQLADSGNVAVLRSVKKALGTNTEIGRGPKSKPMTTIVPLLSSTPDFPSGQSQKFMSEQSQLPNPRNMLGPSVAKPSPAASVRAGTGFGTKQVTPRVVPLPSIMPDLRKPLTREHGPFLNATFSGLTTESRLPGLQAELMVDQSNIENGTSTFGTSPLFGSLAHSKSVLSVESLPQVPCLEQLINEHRPHDSAGKEYVSWVKPLIPNSSGPNKVNLKKLIKEYGSYKTSENSLPGAEDQLFPLATPLSVMVEPLRENVYSTELSPATFCAPFSSSMTSVPLSEDINYLNFLIKQHEKKKENRDHELSQCGKSHKYMNSKDSNRKYQKTCIYYSSSKGCRNGSSCHYKHEIPELRRSDGLLAVTGTKRMKLGEEFTGRR